MKFLISNTNLRQQDTGNLQKAFNVERFTVGSFSILKEESTSVVKTSGAIAFVDGYIREFGFRPEEVDEQTETAIDSIKNQWPVKDNITGSFSCAVINELREEMILCNDPIGVYPLYYLREGKNFYVSNSIIWLAVVSKAEIDEAGLFQRTYCPEFANIGSRTILENCKRLLPGEWIRLNRSGEELEVKYDNSLYQHISSKEVGAISPEEYWEQFKKEITYCTGEIENVHVALSGGMDSRLILGAIAPEKNLSCHTYGGNDYYETRIAERIASLKNAKFRSYSDLSLNFPSKEILQKHTLNTESVFLCSWLEILEAQENQGRDVMLLGDMTESLQGRNLAVGKTFESYLRFYVRQNEIPFKENDAVDLELWKEKIFTIYSGLISEKHIKRINLALSEEVLRKQIRKDLEEVFERIDAHNLPLFELYRELFSWFTHARNPMGKQILQLNSTFKSYCPPMSIQSLRMTSNIHPNSRINGRFVKALFSSVEGIKPFGKVPTSQIPFISYNAPDLFRVPIWFLRSKIDDFLIKKMMKSKKTHRRYRLLKSYNWIEVYHNPDLERNLKSYFESNHLGKGYTGAIIKGAISRRDLENWPLTNVNIINAAALNAELEIISSLKNRDEV